MNKYNVVDVPPDATRDDASKPTHDDRHFRLCVEAAPNAIVLALGTGTMVLVNAQAEHMFGYERGELLGRSLEMLIPERLRAAHPGHRRQFLACPSPRAMGAGRELFAVRKDGTEFPVEIGLNPLQTDEGTLVLCAIVDITARKASQAQLEAALQEKTTLLKEIHHRVKNNLQVISSLLNLQAMNASGDTKQALRQSQERLQAMALIHQLLYERQDFRRIHLGEYLERLARLVLQIYGAEHGRISLSVIGTQVPIYFDMARAAPAGLLVNELLTNAFKHAFPGDRRGTVKVSLVREGDEAALSVADDGVGLPAHVALGAMTSLGFQLVALLVDQMNARLSIDRDQGTQFTLHFKAEGGPSL